MLEAAEIIKATYSGWSQNEIDDFKEMLVYPGWSGTSVPSGDKSFYWNIYNGDRARHGNQGLFAMRSVMAIGVFSDNEVIYNRALRYLQGMNHASNDLPYPSGPPITTPSPGTSNEFYDEFNITSFDNSIEDYGYNELIENYIWETGQSQEASRDQAHAVGGISIIATMCEMAWNQGDDLYSFLDNRVLMGLEYTYRYNLSFTHSFADQPSPWEPTVASGEFIERTDRSGRWKSLKVNPYVGNSLYDDAFLTRGKQDNIPLPQMVLAHYRDRIGLDESEYKWVERGDELAYADRGYEGPGTYTDHPSYGHLTFHRIDESPGDPINGFTSGAPNYNLHTLPTTIEAENYDYLPVNGDGRAYNDTSNGNSGNTYRSDDVDIQVCDEGGYNVGWIAAGEYLTYTVYVSTTGLYDISARIASPSTDGKIRVDFGGSDKTGDVSVPNTGGTQLWQDLTVASGVSLTKGVQNMKVYFAGGNFNLNNISIFESGSNPTSDNLALNGTATQSSNYSPTLGLAGLAIDGDTNGNWSGNSVTHTTTETNPWWQVDLGSKKSIGDINIFNRVGCCMDRLTNFTVSVIDSNGNTTFSQSFNSYPDPSVTVSADNANGRIVKIQLNDTKPLSLAEVQVFEGDGSGVFTPDPNKTYYIDAPYHNLRLAASGESESAYTTSTSVTGNDVAWKFVAKGNGSWHIQRAAGGTLPRLRTDNSENADMQGTAWSGTYTYYNFEEGAIDGTHFITLTDGPTNYKRLQVNSAGEVKMVSTASNGTWESFTITEVEQVSCATFSTIEAEDFDSMSEVVDEGTNIGYIENGNWAMYSNIDLTCAASIDVYASSQTSGGNIEVRLGSSSGTSLGTVEISVTTNWSTYEKNSAAISNVSGIHDVYLVFTGGGGYLFNIDRFEFSANSSSRIVGQTSPELAEDQNISIYPNPIVSTLNLQMPNKEFSKYTIYNVSGKVLFSHSIGNNVQKLELDFEDYAKGIYLLKLEGVQSSKTIRLIKN